MHKAISHKYLLPSTDLRPWIDFYIQHSCPESVDSGVTHLPPSATATLTLALSGQMSLLDPCSGLSIPLSQAFVSGPQTRSTCMVTSGDFRCLVIVFAPGCWHGLIQASPRSLTNDRQDVQGLGCGWLLSLADQLADAPHHRVLHLLEAGLRPWLGAVGMRPRRDHFSHVDTRWMRDTLLHTDPGRTAKVYGLSLRQVERRFLQQFGLTPKTYQRLARMALLIARLGHGSSASTLADMAAELGYADQSHLSRDLKLFTGLQPARLNQSAAENPEYWVYRILPQALANGAGMSRFFNTR